jgi:diguanylate cyclase (GGDEF)-like protein
VFRFGGEEFCVVGPGTPLPEAVRLAERIVRAVRKEPCGREGEPLHVTISIGVAARDGGDADVEALIARSDRALYAAKESGRDRVMAARGNEGGG